MDTKPIFEVHVENWNHALHLENRNHFSDETWLFETLNKHKVVPILYVLYDWRRDTLNYAANKYNWPEKSHGERHYYDEKADRSPYWNQEGIPFPPSGGFFFRLLPIWYLKWAIKKSGVFWIHPHDLDEEHPQLRNPWLHWKRHVGLKQSRLKLERLLKEVEFGNPS